MDTRTGTRDYVTYVHYVIWSWILWCIKYSLGFKRIKTFAGSQWLADKAHKLSGEERTMQSNMWIAAMQKMLLTVPQGSAEPCLRKSVVFESVLYNTLVVNTDVTYN
jgi:hypothetical protein